MYPRTIITMLLGLLLSVFLVGCSGNWVTSTPDEIFDATSGVSNHANDPDSNL